jgi:hypothetical protein
LKCEFGVTPCAEIIDWLEAKSKLKFKVEEGPAKAVITLNNRARLREVLTVIAVSGGFDWTTDGAVIYVGSPESVAKFDREVAARP